VKSIIKSPVLGTLLSIRTGTYTSYSLLLSAWLFEKGLKDGALIWEHSVPLPNYGAVLSLLVIRELSRSVMRQLERMRSWNWSRSRRSLP
jgi:hypothetical protein